MYIDSFAGADLSVVENALQFIESDSRELWIAMGMAIKCEFGESGFSAWDAWSQSAKSYKAIDAKSVWKSIKYSGKTGIGSLFHEAKSRGFKFVQQEMSAEDKKRRNEEIKRREVVRKKAIAEQEALDKKWHRKIASVAQDLAANYLATEGRSDYLDNKKVRAYGLLFVQHGLILVTDDDAIDVEVIAGSENISDFFDSGRRDECSFVYIKSGCVAVPMRDKNDVLVNMQFIFASGNKRFLKHGQKQNTFQVIGGIDRCDRFAIAEGYSTGVSFFKALKIPGIIAFDSGNLLPVAKIWRERKPQAEIIIAGDDDHHLGDKNAGFKKATEAASKVAGKVVFPSFINSDGRSDFNDMAIEQGLDAVRRHVLSQIKNDNYSPDDKPVTALDRLKKLSTTLRVKEMEANLENDCYIFDGIALDGQITLIYALPNTGKTLLFIYFLIAGFKDRRIKPEDVFYINADDSYKGLVTKTQVAESYGFQMISPAEAGVSSKEIIQMLIDLAESGEAKGKIIILDTVKKFVNLMSKQDQSSFHNSLRMLIAKNASVILAGHANKYPDAEGNLIYEGTSDTMNDVDCVYSINRMASVNSNEMVVEFRNEKSRGDVLKKVAYKYNNSEGVDWLDRLKSVTKLGVSEAKAALAEKTKQDKIARYQSEVLFITEILKDGEMNQSEINKKYSNYIKNEKSELHALAAEFSGRELLAALKSLRGIVWKVTRDVKHNANKYELIDTDGANYERVKDGS